MSEETIPEMRERIKVLEKEAKEAKEASAASEAKARLFEAKDAFRTAGYKPEQAALYVAANPDGEITTEAVATFADSYGLAPVEQSKGEPAPESGDKSNPPSGSELTPMGRAGSRPGDGGAAPASTEQMTHPEWMELNRKDPAAAREALVKGRVEISQDNFYARMFNR